MPTINGTAGPDTIIGDQGGTPVADTINGLGGDDTIDGAFGTNILNGGDGNDTISSTGIDDSVNGGNGDDFVRVDSAAIIGGSFQGGAGTGDTIIFAGAEIDASSGAASFAGFEQVGGEIFGGATNDIITLSGLTGLALSASGLQVNAGDGADTLTGGAERDFFFGEAGNDRLNGGDGDDQLFGGAGADIVRGGAGDDAIMVTAVADLVAGDQVDGGTGGDTLGLKFEANSDISAVNLAGIEILRQDFFFFDTALTAAQLNGLDVIDGRSFTLTTSGIVDLGGKQLFTNAINLSAGGNTLILNDNIGFALVINGGAGTDTVTGSDLPDTISGGGGDDMIDGGVGFDTLDGGDGNDILRGGTEDDFIRGGGGNDMIDGGDGGSGTGRDTASYAGAVSAVAVSLTTGLASGGAGNDTLSGIESLLGSSFDDTLTGDAHDNVIDGGAGNDVLDGGGGADVATYQGAAAGVTVSLAQAGAQATGGAGTDALAGFEALIGSAFGDRLGGDGSANVLLGGDGNDLLDGGGSGDTLTGGFGNDMLTGGLGDDFLEGGAGNDVIDGGSGIDTAYYGPAGGAITLTLLSQSAQNTGGGGIDTLKLVENVIGSNFNDSLIGNGGANVLSGGDGNDSLDGGLGNDTLAGGAGTDTANYFRATAGVKVSLAITTAQFTLGSGGDTLSGIENLTGTGFDDQFTGDAGDNNLAGNGGNDLLNGGLGNDLLSGGAGVGDTASYAGGVAVAVSLLLTTQQDTLGAGLDTLTSIEHLTGSSFGDTLAGNAQANRLSGGAGGDLLDGGSAGDTLDGGSGNDTLRGGTGDDLLFGGAGNDGIDGGGNVDTVSYANGGAVIVNLGLATAQAVGGGQGTDTIVNVENIVGSANADTLSGNALANVIAGGGGRDALTGGAGNDRFVYAATGDSGIGAVADRITDFASGDILDLSAIDADASSAGTNEAFHAVASFTSHAGEFTLAFDGGANTTIFLADVTGDGMADMAILFTGDVTGLTASWVL